MVSIAVVACLCAPATGVSAAPSRYGLEDPEAIAHADAATSAANVKDYPKAIEHLKAAYAIEPRPVLLYAWAQAERLAGNYRAAVALYEEFLEQNPEGDIAKQARVNLLDARTKALEQGPDPKAGSDDEDPDEGGQEDPDGGSTTEPDQTETADTTTSTAPAQSPLKREKLAPALLGVGAVVTIAGGVVMGLGRAQVSNSPSAPTEDAYFGEIDSGRTLYYAGAATLGVGGLFLIGGAIRYIIVAQRGKSPKSNATAVVTPHSAGLSFSGRF